VSIPLGKKIANGNTSLYTDSGGQGMSEERKPRVRTDGKEATTVRLTPTGRRLLSELHDRLGMPRSAVLEMLIRQKARDEGLE
jgi:hypothetical protein